MKKYVIILLSVILAFSFCACSKALDAPTPNEQSTTTTRVAADEEELAEKKDTVPQEQNNEKPKDKETTAQASTTKKSIVIENAPEINNQPQSNGEVDNQHVNAGDLV